MRITVARSLLQSWLESFRIEAYIGNNRTQPDVLALELSHIYVKGVGVRGKVIA